MAYPTGKTDLWVIVADPVAHVKAPVFVNPIFEAKRMDAFLLPLHVPKEHFADIVPRLARLGNVKAMVVTIPHKEAMAKLCHELGPNAKLTGAVNAVRIEPGGRLVGEMFDGLGLVATARQAGMAVAGRSVLILGAGGAGRAVAFALAAEGAARIGVWNRSAARAEALTADLVRAFPAVACAAGPADARGYDLVVQCTSLGLHAGDPLPLDSATLAASTDVIDIIAVRDTELMTAARARSCRVVGGRPMVELQLDAQIAFVAAAGGGKS
jgi:shikimate dehydrogenase